MGYRLQVGYSSHQYWYMAILLTALVTIRVHVVLSATSYGPMGETRCPRCSMSCVVPTPTHSHGKTF